MLRFKPTERQPRGTQPWPEIVGVERQTVFTERPSLRRMVVVADDELLLQAHDGAAAPLSILRGLLTDPYISLLRYSEMGPPELGGAPPDPFGEVPPGWLVVGPALPNSPFHYPVAYRTGTSIAHCAITGNSVSLAETETRTPLAGTVTRDEERAQRRADAIAARAAASIGADLFITTRPYLHAVTWALTGDVLIADPNDALPLVGLYLRTQGKYITYRSFDGTGTDTMTRDLFFFVGVRELLPEGWRWFAACVRSGDDDIVYLAQSLFQRVQRALQARDAALRALNQPTTDDAGQVVLDNLDFVLLSLMGAVDVTARVAHRALSLELDEYDAGWQRRRWRRAVREQAAELADLVSAQRDAGKTLLILAKLRNSIHGAALDGLAVMTEARRVDEVLVGLPHTDGDRLVEAMDGLGGRDAWGVQQLVPGRFHADPGLLLEKTFATVVVLLNDLMRLTPVERLGPQFGEGEDDGPPSDEAFSEFNRLSIRWQLGF